mmetsp:Transcript_29636/g.86291  ORF Transcript_29636/g.86291 Transcript_29636/m.86291 type:complete len:456 (+) Transcript_29636:137-1504(+)
MCWYIVTELWVFASARKNEVQKGDLSEPNFKFENLGQANVNPQIVSRSHTHRGGSSDRTTYQNKMNVNTEMIEPTLVEETLQPVERKFFVANLSYETVDGDLFSFFSQYGKVESARVIVDRQTSSSRGFGFITMRDDEGAMAVTDLALRHNNTIEMLGRSSVHLAVHDRDRQKQKADERRQIRAMSQPGMVYGGGGGSGGPGFEPYGGGGGGSSFGPYGGGGGDSIGGGGSFMPPYHPHGHHPSMPSYGGFQPSVQMQTLQPSMHQTQTAPTTHASHAPSLPAWGKTKVSVGGGNGGPPYELLVENLPNQVSIFDLVAKFSTYGTVVGASLRQSVGESSGRPSYARVRFNNPESLAAAVTGRIPTVLHHQQPRSLHLRQSNAVAAPAATDDYGLWRPHPKTAPTPASAPTPTIRADSVEGSLSTWSDSAGNGTAAPFTPPRVGRGGGRGPRPPGF